MKKSELIELATKNGVVIGMVWSEKYNWYADIARTGYELKRFKKLSTLIKFLSDNNIKINN